MNLLPTNLRAGLSADAARLAAAAGLLAIDEIPVHLAAVAAGQPVTVAETAIDDLVSSGLATASTRGRFTLSSALLDAVAAVLPTRDDDSPVQGISVLLEISTRVVDHVAQLVTRLSNARDVRDHSTELLSGVRLGALSGDRGLLATAVTIALTVVEAVPTQAPQTGRVSFNSTLSTCFDPTPPPMLAGAARSDLLWWDRFLGTAEQAAIATRNPDALVEIVQRRACCSNQLGNQPAAERQWMRVLDLRERQGDHAALVAAMMAVSDFYRAWPRLERALDQDDQLVLMQRGAEDLLGHARALVRLGVTLKLASRYDDAAHQLVLAQANYRSYMERDPGTSDTGETGPAGALRRERAAGYVVLGKVHWLRGEKGSASRSFSDALALLVDYDEQAAEEVRYLLKHGLRSDR